MKKQIITNWGNYPKLEASVVSADAEKEVEKLINDSSTILPRGNGRCYGDAALNEHVFSTLKLKKILEFDSESGILECQSGILLSEILQRIVPEGWFLPVTPGTKFVTLGGAIAADVHGKNHHQEGCFSNFLIHFDLMIENGKILRCSRTENAEHFWQTIGNMGLTGIILTARFRLKKIETAYIRQETIKAENLHEVMQLFADSKDHTYTVAWIDCLKKGKHFGRSVLFRGEHALVDELSEKQKKRALHIPSKLKINIPFYFPKFALNNFFIRLFNWAYYHKQRSRSKVSIVDYDTFFYPLDSLHHWNRLYGKSGFTQYQFVLPLENSAAGLVEILETIRESGQGAFLTVLKLFGASEKKAVHSFPVKGYTLALDFKITPDLPKLLSALDHLLEKRQGRVYRAKDAFSKPSLSRTVFQNTGKFTSTQSRRIGM